MRFTLSDWFRLILSCIAASAAMALVSGSVWLALGARPILLHQPGFAGSPNAHFAVTLALGLLYMPLNALAAWPVLRSCVNGLRLAPWLTETALGAVLGGIVSIPAMAFLLFVPGSVPPLPGNPVGWLPSVAAGVAALLPPGLLLQRLGRVRAWPSLIVVAATMAAIPAVWRGTTLPEMLPLGVRLLLFIVDGRLLLVIPAQPWLSAMAVAVVMSGVLSGLTLGAGLFLMGRLSRSAIAR